MERRSVGKSAIQWSVLGMGCGPNAGLFVNAAADTRHRTVSAAVRSGITLFDTAADYASGSSETNVGIELREITEVPTIVTKVNIAMEQLDDILGAVHRSVAASLDRLGVDHVDAVMLHNRVDSHGDHNRIVGIGPLLSLGDIFGPVGVATAFQELQRVGTVGLTGFTAYGGEADAIDVLLDSGVFDVINAEYSPLVPSAGGLIRPIGEPDYAGVIARASQRGHGVMAIRVLGGGSLIGPTRPHSWAAQVQEWCVRYAGSIAAGALRFALSDPAVTTAVIGFTDADQVTEAVAAVAEGPLPAEALAELAELSEGGLVSS